MANSQHQGLVVFFFCLFIWMILPDSEYATQSLILSDTVDDRLKGFRGALDVLNQTAWGDFAPSADSDEPEAGSYIDLVGFREDDGFAWEDLSRFRERGLQLSRYAMSTGTQQPWDMGEGYPLWSNPSGTLHGDWVRKPGSAVRHYDSYNLTNNVPAMRWVHDNVDWARNITGPEGRMVLMLEANKTVMEYDQPSEEEREEDAPLSGGQVRAIKATVTLEDTTGTSENWEMRLWGVHWPRQGVILMTTTSEKFDGIFGLPHLTPSLDFYQSSQMLLNRSLDQTLAEKEKRSFADQTVPWSSDIDNPLYTKHPSPHCELILYAQVHPPRSTDAKGSPQYNLNMAKSLSAIEHEIDHPLGAPVPTPPELEISSVIYSPDCSFFLETRGPPEFSPFDSQHLTGLKKEVHLHQVKSWLLVYAVIIFCQVLLVKSQLAESYTPSTMARVSFGTASIMVLVDGMTFTSAATWVSSAASTFLPTLTVMFAAFLSMIIGGRFLAKIYEVQLPEGRNRRDQSATDTGTATPTPIPPQIPDSGAILPAPVTAGRPRRIPTGPVIVPSDQDVDAEIMQVASGIVGNGSPGPIGTEPMLSFQTIIGRYVLISLGIGFLAISSTTWYPALRSAFLNLCAFLYLSLWVPQFHRNVMRNCRRALRWQFVAGQSFVRVLPIAYFWVKPDNFLYARTEPRAFAALCGWLWLQIVVLIAQDVVGPRFGIPTSWTPDAWDYHPVLKEDNLEAGGLPIGLVTDDHPGLDRTRSGEQAKRSANATSNTRSIDCAICREILEVPVLKAGEEPGSVARAFARRLYMVTPCRHIFHSACLEGWLKFRLQCPICREELPPL